MKKIYPFKKEILFKNNIYEILSIAIDKKFSIDGYALKGQFKINGEYLVKENEKDNFDINISYLNYIEDIYDISQIKVDIDDFYYEIKDSNCLVVNIDVAVDGLEEKEILIEDMDIRDSSNILDLVEDVEAKGELIDDDDPPFEDVEEVIEEIDNNEEAVEVAKVENDFTLDNEVERPNNKLDNDFVTYRVCLVRDGDTFESIMNKYEINMDILKKYNTINELKVGDKLIIPYEKN